MEVFVAYTKHSLFNELEATLEAWDLVHGAEPVAIEITNEKKYEIFRRVTAENMSSGDYILADLCCLAEEQDFVSIARDVLKEKPEAGLLAASPGMGVWVCRKGIVDKWPTKETMYYAKEHAEAYRRKGYEAELCDKLHYHRLSVLLPS